MRGNGLALLIVCSIAVLALTALIQVKNAEIDSTDAEPIPVSSLARARNSKIETLNELRRDEVSIDEVIDDLPSVASCPEIKPFFLAELSDSAIVHVGMKIASVLEVSKDPEHLLAAALVRGMRAESGAAELFSIANSMAPKEPLIAWNHFLYCSLERLPGCDLIAARSQALKVAGDNGAVWMEAAATHLRTGFVDDATESIRQAISAPRFESYFLDHALLFERAFAASTDWSYAKRVVAGIGYAAAMPSSFNEIVQWCGKTAGNADIRVELCDQLGSKMFSDGRDLMTQGIGLAIRQIAAESGFDELHKARVMALKNDFTEAYHSARGSKEVNNLLFNDERVLRDYLQHFARYGELEAQDLLSNEALRLRELPGYDKCNFVNSAF